MVLKAESLNVSLHPFMQWKGDAMLPFTFTPTQLCSDSLEKLGDKWLILPLTQPERHVARRGDRMGDSQPAA